MKTKYGDVEVHAHMCVGNRPSYGWRWMPMARHVVGTQNVDLTIIDSSQDHVSEKRNRMLSRSIDVCDWIVCFDDDDWKCPDYVRTAIEWCIANGRGYIVRGDAYIYDLIHRQFSTDTIKGYGAGHWVISTKWLRRYRNVRFRRHEDLSNKSDHQFLELAKRHSKNFTISPCCPELVGNMIRFRHRDNIAPVRSVIYKDDPHGTWLSLKIGRHLAQQYLALEQPPCQTTIK